MRCAIDESAKDNDRLRAEIQSWKDKNENLSALKGENERLIAQVQGLKEEKKEWFREKLELEERLADFGAGTTKSEAATAVKASENANASALPAQPSSNSLPPGQAGRKKRSKRSRKNSSFISDQPLTSSKPFAFVSPERAPSTPMSPPIVKLIQPAGLPGTPVLGPARASRARSFDLNGRTAQHSTSPGGGCTSTEMGHLTKACLHGMTAVVRLLLSKGSTPQADDLW